MAHLTVAVSEGTFQKSVDALVRNLSFEKADQTSFGAFTAGYDVKAHLEGGTVDLRADNTIQLKELDLRWDRLKFILGIDIPEICVGGGCIDLPWPLPDLCLPRVCIFSDDPDISIEPDLAAFVAQEVSFTGSLLAQYHVSTTPGESNKWQIFIDPQTIDVDLFDFPDIVGNLIEDALTDLITALIPGGPVRDLIIAIIGGVSDLIRDILDIPDDIQEWLSDLFNVSFGLLDFIGTLILDYFASENPIYEFDDPFQIMEASNGLIPVRIPIRNLDVHVTDVEMVVQADVGA
ncbi:MAG: hypothetical protein R3E39_12230 [Anaerolineae bacterium]